MYSRGMTHAGIVLVPHTHWDREWYEPFQVFRFRLVEALDDVLDMAEANPDFRFTLDGQTAAIEDYLEIRPEARPRVERAVREGQLALGPWLILLDEGPSTFSTGTGTRSMCCSFQTRSRARCAIMRGLLTPVGAATRSLGWSERTIWPLDPS
jgi:alpha-mannosidase